MSLSPEFEEKVRKIKEDAKRRQEEEYRSSSSSVEVPKIWIQDGLSKFRFGLDSDGRHMRIIERHKKGQTWVQCTGHDCGVCQAIDELGDWNNQFQWRVKTIVLTVGWMFSYEHGDASGNPGFMVTEKWGIVMQGQRLEYRYRSLLADMDDDDVVAFFTPETPFNLVSVDSSNKSRDFNMSLIPKKLAVDPVPSTIPPLSTIFFNEGEKPEKRQIDKFINLMIEDYQQHS